MQNTIGMNDFPFAVPNYKIFRATNCSFSYEGVGGRREGSFNPSLLYSKLCHVLEDTVS